jgi:hypothetical protein
VHQRISKTFTGTGAVLVTDLTLPALARLPTPTLGLQAMGKIAGFSLPTHLNEHAFDTLQGIFDIGTKKGEAHCPSSSMAR